MVVWISNLGCFGSSVMSNTRASVRSFLMYLAVAVTFNLVLSPGASTLFFNVTLKAGLETCSSCTLRVDLPVLCSVSVCVIFFFFPNEANSISLQPDNWEPSRSYQCTPYRSPQHQFCISIPSHTH